MTRRDFSRLSAGFLTTNIFTGRIFGANDRISVGVIGAGGRGQSLTKTCFQNNLAEVSALSDVSETNLRKGQEIVNRRARECPDFEDLLAQRDIDAVIIATPDHWHALMTVMACRAGKDVYVEKPIADSIDAQWYMKVAALQHKRVVQVGTQQRSNLLFQNAKKIIASKALGEIFRIGTWYSRCGNIGITANSTHPPDLDWDMWLGPAPWRRYNSTRASWMFRFFWDYAGGHMTDWGVHLLDTALWTMNQVGPKEISADGWKYISDDKETPDNLFITYLFSEFLCTFYHSPSGSKDGFCDEHGIEFRGTEGTLIVSRFGYEVYDLAKNRKKRKKIRRGNLKIDGQTVPFRKMGRQYGDTAAHLKNFFDCVKNRREPVSSIHNHHATAMCQLGNVAWLSGKTLIWNRKDEEAGTISPPVGNPQRIIERVRHYREPWKKEMQSVISN